MKRAIYSAIIGLLLSLALAGCAPAAIPSPAAGQPPGGAQPLHTLVDLQGQLSLKREGWRDFAPALFGASLRQGDLLRLEGAGQASVACADLSLVLVQPGIGAVPCKAGKPILTYAGSLVNPTRWDASDEFPMIISPRKTRLLNPRPTLRWSAPAGAQDYKVTVHGAGLTWSTTVKSANEVAYPADAPALAAGASYKLTVTAGERSSDEEASPGLGFTMLSAEEARAVRDAEAKIHGMNLPAASAQFLLANLYASYDLNAEAIELLEALAQSASEPAIPRALGDLYLKVGLNRLAEARYLAGLGLAQRAGDIEGQAWMQSRLGLIYQALSLPADARQRIQNALELYQKLGEAETVRELQGRLDSLKP
jgi:hypothetical protein